MSRASCDAEKNILFAHFFLRPAPSLAPPHVPVFFSVLVSITLKIWWIGNKSVSLQTKSEVGGIGTTSLGNYFFFRYVKSVKVKNPKQILKSSMTVSIVASDFILAYSLRGFRHPLCNHSLITLQRYEKYLNCANFFKGVLKENRK